MCFQLVKMTFFHRTNIKKKKKRLIIMGHQLHATKLKLSIIKNW